MTNSQKQIQKILHIERQVLSVQLQNVSGQEKTAFSGIVEEHVRNRMQLKLASIERALSRLEKGTYGVCQTCGNEIDPERLSALPYAEQCIGCQRQLEQRTISRYAPYAYGYY